MKTLGASELKNGFIQQKGGVALTGDNQREDIYTQQKVGQCVQQETEVTSTP